MIGSICARWKQVVAYYFTPNSLDGSLLKPIILEIIEKAESIGLRIHSITTDMGPVNRRMWSSFQIGVSRHSEIRNATQHPCDKNRQLFFLADAPHLLKNLKNCFITNRIMTMPEVFRRQNNFNFPIIKCKHLDELLDLQENIEFRLTPKLTSDDINCGTFGKMRVNKAKHVFSRDVSSALHFLAETNAKEEYTSTAWFIETISKWFTIITSRSPHVALGIREDMESLNKYNSTVLFLESVIELFINLNIGLERKNTKDRSKVLQSTSIESNYEGNGCEKCSFKPVQAGIILTTKSIIELSDYLLSNRGYLFVLGGRFTQDCLENLFSLIRVRNVVPNALQFKQNLKLIAISQYIKPLQHSNYDEDDRQFLHCFNRQKSRKKPEQISFAPDLILPASSLNVQLNNIEMNILYNIAGYIISSISKSAAICKECLDSAGSVTPLSTTNFSKLVQLRCYRKNTLFYVNEDLFLYFLEMEKLIRAYFPHLKQFNNNVHFLQRKMASITCSGLKNCHGLLSKITKRFIIYRLRIASSKHQRKTKIYSSKSMAMHATQ